MRSCWKNFKKKFQISAGNEHLKCGRLSQSRFKDITRMNLKMTRLGLVAPLICLLVSCFVAFDIMFFLYYETFWGFIASLVSVMSSLRATKYPEKWQQLAIISSEISLSLNLVITLLFWSLIAPTIYPQLEWTGTDLFLRFNFTLLHTLPLFSTVLNVTLTDMTFLKKDWYIVFSTGILYAIFNGIGTWALGHQIYPYVDWENPMVTMIIFVSLAAIMAGIHLLIAKTTVNFKNR